jgi:hypothetical protein
MPLSLNFYDTKLSDELSNSFMNDMPSAPGCDSKIKIASLQNVAPTVSFAIDSDL